MARVNKTGLLKRKIKVNRTIAQFHPERLRYYCPPTLVKGGYSNVFVCPYIPPSVHTSLRPSVHLSLDTILSPHSSYSFQGILMKLSSYCSYDLKMIIFYRGHAQLIFTRVIALWQFFNSKSRLQFFLQFSVDFNETFQLLLPWSDHIIRRSRLTAFYQSYGPLSVLAIYQQKFLSPQLLLHFSRDIDETFQLLFP